MLHAGPGVGRLPSGTPSSSQGPPADRAQHKQLGAARADSGTTGSQVGQLSSSESSHRQVSSSSEEAARAGGGGGGGSGRGLEEGDEEFDEDSQSQSGDGDDDAIYFTLKQEGPQTSTGSKGHPEECTPCTFYCFAKRGCKRGAGCKFCHLFHQSKLQLRRDAWKQQQRLKRKALSQRNAVVAAEVVAAATSTRRSVPACGGGPFQVSHGHGSGVDGVNTRRPPAAPQLGALGGGGLGNVGARRCQEQQGSATRISQEQQQLLREAFQQPSQMQRAVPLLTYTPDKVVLAVGQRMECLPRLAGAAPALRFSCAPLPAGLMLDPHTGILHMSCEENLPAQSVQIQAQLADGRVAQTAIQLEAIDFTQGGFVMGHLEELEPGRFMALLYLPKGEQADGASSLSPDLIGSFAASHQEATCCNGGAYNAAGQEQEWQQPRHWVSVTPDCMDNISEDSDYTNSPLQAQWPCEQAGSSVLQLSEAIQLGCGHHLEIQSMTAGSASHHAGTCSPCAFMYKDGGCQSGGNCLFCHLCGPGEKRRRKKGNKDPRGCQRPMVPA